MDTAAHGWHAGQRRRELEPSQRATRYPERLGRRDFSSNLTLPPADRGRAEGSLRYFILPRAFASPPSACGMPCGHLPRTLRGQFGKQPYPEHRALRPGGRGIARARCAASASLKSQSPALTYRRAARAEWLPVRFTALWKRSHFFSHIVEQEQRSLFRSCFLPAEHIGNSKELAPTP